MKWPTYIILSWYFKTSIRSFMVIDPVLKLIYIPNRWTLSFTDISQKEVTQLHVTTRSTETVTIRVSSQCRWQPGFISRRYTSLFHLMTLILLQSIRQHRKWKNTLVMFKFFYNSVQRLRDSQKTAAKINGQRVKNLKRYLQERKKVCQHGDTR